MRVSLYGLLLILTVEVISEPARVTPADEVRVALADCNALPVTDRAHVRYLTMYAIIPPDKRKNFYKAINFHCNSLSRAKGLHNFYPPKVISDSLLRIDLRHYQWLGAVWEKLAEADPWFHEQVVKVAEGKKRVVKKVKERKLVPIPGRPNHYTEEFVTKKVVEQEAKPGKEEVIVTSAHWLEPKDIAQLIEHTQSKVPIVRADWFLYWSGAQEDRGGAGYYDFLGIKDRDGFETLVALDKRAATLHGRELGALVGFSGVSNYGRQIFAWSTILGRTWFTLDPDKKPVAERNPLRAIDGTFEHDGEEAYGFLSNGLLATWAGDDEGNTVEVVPEAIASEDVKIGRDGRIHTFVSCVRCHTEGLKPINDWARSVFRNDLKLIANAKDKKAYEKYERLKVLYFTDLADAIKTDQAQYAKALLKCNGMAPAENASNYWEWHRWYIAEPVTLTQACIELGVTEDQFVKALKASLSPKKGGGDLVLGAFLAKDPQPLRREHWEEAYPLAQQYLRGITK